MIGSQFFIHITVSVSLMNNCAHPNSPKTFRNRSISLWFHHPPQLGWNKRQLRPVWLYPQPLQQHVLVGGFKHLDYVPFHIWDVILPIDELHHFSRWAHCTTNQCKFRFIRFTLSREFLFCLRHPIFCERLSNSFCCRHVLVRRLLEMHLRLRPESWVLFRMHYSTMWETQCQYRP